MSAGDEQAMYGRMSTARVGLRVEVMLNNACVFSACHPYSCRASGYAPEERLKSCRCIITFDH